MLDRILNKHFNFYMFAGGVLAGALIFWLPKAYAIFISTPPVTQATQLQTGALSLGTTTAAGTLQIAASSTYPGISVSQTTNLTAGVVFEALSATTTRFVVTSNGKIGIATSTPATNLSVQGNALISGNLTAASITATGTLGIAGKTYTFSSDQMATGTVFTNDGNNFIYGNTTGAKTASGWVTQIEGSTAQLVIPHTLSGTPARIGIMSMTQMCNDAGTLAYPEYSYGTSTAALKAYTYSWRTTSLGAESDMTSSTTAIMFGYDAGSVTRYEAYVQAINSTNIVINWAKNTAGCVTNANIANPVIFINWTAEL